MTSNFIRSTVFSCALLTAGVGFASSIEGPADSGFYDVPAMSNSEPGQLYWYREAQADLGDDAPAFSAWNILYESQDALGADNYVSGTVFEPTEPWSGDGERPVIAYAVGTHGLGLSCAPSKQFDLGKDYENHNIAQALSRGYSVVVSDYPGYTNDSEYPYYLVGKAQANAVMDSVRATYQLPDADISADADVGVWGFSQGAQTAVWVGETMTEYAPELNIIGVAHGGVPADFLDTADYLNGSTGMSFLLGGVVGLSQQYPEALPIADYVNNRGAQALEDVKSQCVFETLFALINTRLSDYTINGETLSELLATIDGAEEAVLAQNVGNNEIPVPVYQYHGQADEFIRLEQAYALKERHCDLGSRVQFDLYPSEHIATQFQAAPYVLDWMDERMNAGFFDVAPSSCLTFKGAPESTANPSGGDFIVSLDAWSLAGEISIAKLDDAVILPEASTFTGDANISQGLLEGNLAIPDSRQELSILVNLDTDLIINEVGTTQGSISLDNEGVLSISGSSITDIEVESAGFGWLQIPLGCKTEAPSVLPLEFEGPVSSLGGGKLQFVGETEIANFTDCGLYGPLLNTLISGENNAFDIRITPPEPVAN